MSDKEPAVEKIAEEGVRDAEQGLTGVAPPPEHHGHHEHKKRTLGNRIFDLAVWPTIAFGAVYGLSTWAVKAAEQKEGSNWVKSLHEKLSSTFAKMYTEEPVKKGNALSLVILSFAVGTALMAPIKLLEDRRQKISQWIDHKLGTEPADPSHYKKEPKQTWGSVLGGRLVTFLSVMGINAAVGKHTDAITEKAADIVKERWKKINPAVTEQRLKDVHPWIKANAFELFYTTVCASMVYF